MLEVNFDAKCYLSQSPSLPRGTSPLKHFLERGAREGRKPNVSFDPVFYLRVNNEVAEAGLNPLVHYVRWGAREKRLIHPPLTVDNPTRILAARPTLPSREEWALALPHRPGEASLDVIVPVYKGRADTLRCLHRVLTARNETPFELIVIDDCSPDPELSRDLRAMAERALFTYLHNESNLGFVGAVNCGMSLHPDRDVILLNSDTEVFGDWIDRLRRVGSQHERAGTITPFSNNATICSYPWFARDNEMLLELNFDELDKLACQVNGDAIVDLPTAVGFCMYIKRECLTETGMFNQELFGKGYGEENDFCRRAHDLQWRNVLACGVFVRHTGGASFQHEKSERVEQALKALEAVHPGYLQTVRAFLCVLWPPTCYSALSAAHSAAVLPLCDRPELGISISWRVPA